MISLGLLSKLWGLSWVRGTALSIGILVAVISWGALKRRDGYSEGYREAKRITEAAWNADAALAREVAAGIKARTDSLTRALRDSLTKQTALVARLSEARARAQGQYAAALEAYQTLKAASGDSLPPELVTACDAVASSCTNALAAAEREKDGLVMQLRTAEALAVAQTDYATKEPERWKPIIADALSEQRRSFQAPSRTRWFAMGAAAGRASCELRR
jgi:hypothetical protein